MKHNGFSDKLRPWYVAGFSLILTLPLLTLPPYFFPADWGKTIIFRSLLAIFSVLFIWKIFYKKEPVTLPNLKKNNIAWALAALFLVFLLATIFSVDPLFSLWGSPYRGGGFVTFAFYMVFALGTFILFKKEDWKKAWIFSIIIGVLVSCIALIQYFGAFNNIFLSVSSQPSSTLGNPILLAIYLLLLFFPTLSLAIKEKKKSLKACYIFCLALFLFTILISGTRAAYLGIAVGILYFLLSYPKKLVWLKICLGLFLLLIISTVTYANLHPELPEFLKNRITEGIVSQLSLKKAFNDGRYPAWQIVAKEIQDKPILGWGPENLSVGFDKNYDPLVTPTPWWDRAHNIIMQTGSDAGILGIIAYLALLISVFWQMQKIKSAHKEDTRFSLIPHAIQTTLIGYFVANLFSFDSFSSYLIFFLLVGYSMHLIAQEYATQPHIVSPNIKGKPLIIGVALIFLLVFLWQDNILPFYLNGQINKASDLANAKQCDQSLALMDNVLEQHTFLDSYARIEYVEFTKTCTNFYPENNLAYVTEDFSLVQQAVTIQPLYTRFWIFLGSGADTLAKQAQDANIKNNLIKESEEYLADALQLAPKHQEIFIEQAKTAITAGDYSGAQQYAQQCIALNSNLGDCYWYLGISEIYAKNITNAKKNMTLASAKGYNTYSLQSLNELSDAYGSLADYQDLVEVYQQLIFISPNMPQYHSSLAFFYAQLGQYANARKEAMIVLRLSPESKPNVDAFLATLPQ